MTDQELYDKLAEAIVWRKVIIFKYKGEKRIAEPFKIGILRRNNRIYLEAWQLAGYSKSGKLPPWRLYRIERIKALEVTDIEAASYRPGYKPTDLRMSEIAYAHQPEVALSSS